MMKVVKESSQGGDIMEPASSLMVRMGEESLVVIQQLMTWISCVHDYVEVWSGSMTASFSIAFLVLAVVSFLYTGPAGCMGFFLGVLFRSADLKEDSFHDLLVAIQRSLIYSLIAFGYLVVAYATIMIVKASIGELPGVENVVGLITSVAVPGAAAMILHRCRFERMKFQTLQLVTINGWLWLAILGRTGFARAASMWNAAEWFAVFGSGFFILALVLLHFRTRGTAIQEAKG
jgi:hypothetical protein